MRTPSVGAWFHQKESTRGELTLENKELVGHSPPHPTPALIQGSQKLHGEQWAPQHRDNASRETGVVKPEKVSCCGSIIAPQPVWSGVPVPLGQI